MPKTPQVVRIGSPADIVCAVVQRLGFRPKQSLVIVCVTGPRSRFGLTLRYDLEVEQVPEQCAEVIAGSIEHDDADSAFVVVFSESTGQGGALAHQPLIDVLVDELGPRLKEALLVTGDRWWSYLCDLDCCGGAVGKPLDWQSDDATSIAAAYAMLGQGVLPDREAVVRSVALELDAGQARAAGTKIRAITRRHHALARTSRRIAIRSLLRRLIEQSADPRASVSADDAAEFTALCADVIVRDEVLVRGATGDDREALIPVLREIARQTPPPYDAPVCSMLAWMAYAHGDGVVANIAIDRALATDPEYSLALLIADALQRLVPPRLLEEVMRGAAIDLDEQDATG
jgi:Domain of unknown function (DUF4192)